MAESQPSVLLFHQVMMRKISSQSTKLRPRPLIALCLDLGPDLPLLRELDVVVDVARTGVRQNEIVSAEKNINNEIC